MPKPFDPMCGKFAADLEYLDDFIRESDDDPTVITPEMREAYVRSEEGTYNPENGHFLCDGCYITAGMPSSPSGWRCP
jgi:hypothetical protein